MRTIKRYILLFVIPFTLLLSCKNHSVTEEKYSDPDAFAELTYLEDFFDAGTIQSGEVVGHNFSFKNTGTKPLVVKDIIPSCGCTQVDVKQKVLKPGEVSSLEVVFDSKGWFGSQYKTVTLRTNGIIREKSVTLKVNVVP